MCARFGARGRARGLYRPLPGLRLGQADPELSQVPRIRVTRSARHRVDARLVLREGDGVAQIWLAREDHHRAVDAPGDPAVRRRSHRERVEEEAELRTLLLGADPQQVE